MLHTKGLPRIFYTSSFRCFFFYSQKPFPSSLGDEVSTTILVDVLFSSLQGFRYANRIRNAILRLCFIFVSGWGTVPPRLAFSFFLFLCRSISSISVFLRFYQESLFPYSQFRFDLECPNISRKGIAIALCQFLRLGCLGLSFVPFCAGVQLLFSYVCTAQSWSVLRCSMPNKYNAMQFN